MNPVNLYEAYSAVYNQEVTSVEEDFSFIDDLSDNELVKIMEEILSEEEVTLQECLDIFDSEILSEETELERMNRLMNQRTREKKAAAATAKREKSAERERVGRKHALKRLQVATTRAGRNLSDKAKTLGAGAASAVAGGASEAGRKAQAGAEKVKGKLASAKEKIKKFVGKVGKAAKAGYTAAKKEFSGEAGKEAKARTTGRQMRRAAKKNVTRDTSEFEKAPEGTSENPRIGQPGKERLALPAGRSKPSSPAAESGRRIKAAAKAQIAAAGSTSTGTRYAGPAGVSPLASKKKDQQRLMGAASGVKKKKTVREDFDILAEIILEDLINEGYAETFEEAFEVLESFSDYEVGQIAENYLVEEREDLFDTILEHLINEGYADTEEGATVIMANMSEEWRSEILEII